MGKLPWGVLKDITYAVNENGCHNCTSHVLDRDGYPQCKQYGKSMRMSHYIYKMHKGDIPSGQIIMHTCDNPSCINPEHLFVGTYMDNMKDMINKGRKVTCPGEKHWNTILSENQIIEIINTKGKTQKELSAIYGVSAGTIGHIKRMERWKYMFDDKVKYGINHEYIKNGKCKGEGHYMAKLTTEKVHDIRNRTDINCHQMAKIYGVAFQTISDIRRGKSWKSTIV